MSNNLTSKPLFLITLFTLFAATIFLAACGQTTETAVAANGLRELNTNTAEVNETTTIQTADTATTADTVEQSLPASSQPGTLQQGNGNYGNGSGSGNSNGQTQAADRSLHVFDPTTAPNLTQGEIEALQYMREEEKLARDVYLALYEQWGLPVFQNISSGEQAHMDSVLFIMEQYEIADPAADNGQGEFTNPVFQQLYADLIAQGSQSLADALAVGAAIEELDITDLQVRLAETENEYILQIFNNLLSGSENHLRAFASQYERQAGSTYQPQYLDSQTFQAIMSGSNGNGPGGGNGTGSGGNGNGNGNGRGNSNGGGQGQGNGNANGRGNGRNNNA